MRSDPRFLEAWVNRRDHRVFGRRLHPLCLLDLVALEAVASPFLPDEDEEAADPDRPVTPSDFLLAVEILSAPPSPHLDVDPAMLSVGLRVRFAAWRYRGRLEEEHAKLRAYFDDFYSSVEIWRTDSTGKAIAAPWMLAKAAFLLRHTHLEERRIWTAPIGQLLCYATAIEEQVTDAQVVTPEEHRAMAEQRELDRRLAAELVGTSAAAPKS